MKNKLFIISLSVLMSISSSVSYAKLRITTENAFSQKVSKCLKEASSSSIYLAKLIEAANQASTTISIVPITNDKSTWHTDGNKTRSHTETQDGKKRGIARNRPTDCIIYINVNRITSSHKTYKSGVLVHELVHAVDLAYGRYNKSYKIREKRAVFFQNLWRITHNKKLRSDYHGRFETNELQTAVAQGKVDYFLNHYFKNNDIP